MSRKNSLESDPSSPTYLPKNFDDWSVRPMPLDPRKISKRTAFWDNYHGSPTIVGRLQCDEYEGGCIAYTKMPLPVGAAWRITMLENYDDWEKVFTAGLTSAKPDRVPDILSLVDFGKQKNFNYQIRYRKPEEIQEYDELDGVRRRSSTLTRPLPYLWKRTVRTTLCFLLTTNGQLHLYLDGKYKDKLESQIPVDLPLWGNVDIIGCCRKVKSEMLLPKELGEKLGLPPCQKDPALPPMPCFDRIGEKCEVEDLEQNVGVAPRSMGVMVKIPPGAIGQAEVPTTMCFATCSPKGSNYAFPDGFKPLGPIYYISSNKQLTKEVEVLAEHNANITTEEEAKEMIFCMAQPPEDDDNDDDIVRFSPVQSGEFKQGEDQGKLITNKLGFISAGTKTASTSKLEKRYAMMCCYTNEEGDVQNVALSMSIANRVYMTNFKDAMKKKWRKSVFDITRIPVFFPDSESTVSVNYEEEVQGWKVMADTKHCNFTNEMVEYEEHDDMGEEYYPPRYIFTIKATDAAEPCHLSYNITGLTGHADFQVPLNPKQQSTHNPESEVEVAEDSRPDSIAESRPDSSVMSQPDMLLLEMFGDIRIIEETTMEYSAIGCRLLNDKHGNRVEAIEMGRRDKPREIMTEIYRKWLREDEYHSWATLCDCYRSCRLGALALRIEQLLGIRPPVKQSSGIGGNVNASAIIPENVDANTEESPAAPLLGLSEEEESKSPLASPTVPPPQSPEDTPQLPPEEQPQNKCRCC